MDKLSLLRNYAPCRKRDAWAALGENVIKTSTKFYNEGMIYRISTDTNDTISNSSLTGCLIYCAEEYVGRLNWNNALLVDEDYGEITFGNDIISSHFYVILSCAEFNAISEDVDESFTPFKELKDEEDTVLIKDSDYRIIMSCLGGPFIRDEELEYTREEVSELAIRPALETMFKWCPKTRADTYSVTTDVQNIAMPSDAYGVVGLSLQQYGAANAIVNNPILWTMTVAPYLTGGMTGSFMKGGSDRAGELLGRNAANQGLINYKRRVHYEGPYVDRDGSITGTPDDKYIRVYSNTQGTFNIWWAIHTLNFDDIEFAQRDNAFKLCQAKVKQLFGNLRRQTKTDIPGQVDYEYLVKEGVEEEKEVVEVLKKLVKTSWVERGSL
jgi:hypothetical protein